MTLGFRPWRDTVDERELLRLDLVGLAAEVATLSTRIDEELLDMFSPEAPRLHALRRALSDRALSVLAPHMSFDQMSMDAMRSAVAVLQDDQRQMLELRAEVAYVADGFEGWLWGSPDVPELRSSLPPGLTSPR